MSFKVHGYTIHVEVVPEGQIFEMEAVDFLDAAIAIALHRMNTDRDLFQEWIDEVEHDWYDRGGKEEYYVNAEIGYGYPSDWYHGYDIKGWEDYDYRYPYALLPPPVRPWY